MRLDLHSRMEPNLVILWIFKSQRIWKRIDLMCKKFEVFRIIATDRYRVITSVSFWHRTIIIHNHSNKIE